MPSTQLESKNIYRVNNNERAKKQKKNKKIFILTNGRPRAETVHVWNSYRMSWTLLSRRIVDIKLVEVLVFFFVVVVP